MDITSITKQLKRLRHGFGAKILTGLLLGTVMTSLTVICTNAAGNTMPSIVYDPTPINVRENPVQTNYSEAEKDKKTIVYKSFKSNETVKLIPQAHYKISGTTIAFNYTFPNENLFDRISLYDIGLVWGDISDPNILKKYFTATSQKTNNGARRLELRWHNTQTPKSYIPSHTAHTHLIPANKNILQGLYKINMYDRVTLEGELVDMRALNGWWLAQTSLSRDDFDETSRSGKGNGAREVMYVTKLKVENYVYK